MFVIYIKNLEERYETIIPYYSLYFQVFINHSKHVFDNMCNFLLIVYVVNYGSDDDNQLLVES